MRGPSITLPRHRSAKLFGVILAAAALAACSTPAASPSSDGGGGTAVDVTLSEFKVEFNTTDIPAGDVTFNVTNDGTIVHEFVVFRTDVAEDALPEQSDEPEVNEDDPSLTSMGEVEDVEVGSTKSFSANLEAGDYVGICNVEGHYDSGMHIHFTVS
ncbi:MAG: sulfocyanin-like copper-binding protein [Chloroflexota bacterium]